LGFSNLLIDLETQKFYIKIIFRAMKRKLALQKSTKLH